MSTSADIGFRLYRHSGRSNGEWREVHTRHPCTEYDRMAAALRQGGVRLMLNDQLVRETWAPRLRTCW